MANNHTRKAYQASCVRTRENTKSKIPCMFISSQKTHSINHKYLGCQWSSKQIFHIVFHNLLYGLIMLIWLRGCIILLGNV